MLCFLPTGALSLLLRGREGEIWFMLLKLGEEMHSRGQELTPAHPAKMAQWYQGPSLGLGQAPLLRLQVFGNGRQPPN